MSAITGSLSRSIITVGLGRANEKGLLPHFNGALEVTYHPKEAISMQQAVAKIFLDTSKVMQSSKAPLFKNNLITAVQRAQPLHPRSKALLTTAIKTASTAHELLNELSFHLELLLFQLLLHQVEQLERTTGYEYATFRLDLPERGVLEPNPMVLRPTVSYEFLERSEGSDPCEMEEAFIFLTRYMKTLRPEHALIQDTEAEVKSRVTTYQEELIHFASHPNKLICKLIKIFRWDTLRLFLQHRHDQYTKIFMSLQEWQRRESPSYYEKAKLYTVEHRDFFELSDLFVQYLTQCIASNKQCQESYHMDADFLPEDFQERIRLSKQRTKKDEILNVYEELFETVKDLSKGLEQPIQKVQSVILQRFYKHADLPSPATLMGMGQFNLPKKMGKDLFAQNLPIPETVVKDEATRREKISAFKTAVVDRLEDLLPVLEPLYRHYNFLSRVIKFTRGDESFEILYHRRVLTWFEDSSKALSEPRFRSLSPSIKDKIRFFHTFPLEMDLFTETHFAFREKWIHPDDKIEKTRIALPGKIERAGQVHVGLFVYVFDLNGTCYHRCFHEKGFHSMMNALFANDVFREVEFPNMEGSTSDRKALKIKTKSDLSYEVTDDRGGVIIHPAYRITLYPTQ